MHGSCYFHHTVLSGVIVLPAPSAQIAVVFTDCCFGVYFNRLPPLTVPVIPLSVLHCLMEMEVKDPVASINWSLSPEWCGTWFQRGSKSSCLLSQSWSSLSGHSGECEEESGPALEPMHYFTQQVTAQHTGTNANRRQGVSERCVCVLM